MRKKLAILQLNKLVYIWGIDTKRKTAQVIQLVNNLTYHNRFLKVRIFGDFFYASNQKQPHMNLPRKILHPFFND